VRRFQGLPLLALQEVITLGAHLVSGGRTDNYADVTDEEKRVQGLVTKLQINSIAAFFVRDISKIRG